MNNRSSPPFHYDWRFNNSRVFPNHDKPDDTSGTTFITVFLCIFFLCFGVYTCACCIVCCRQRRDGRGGREEDGDISSRSAADRQRSSSGIGIDLIKSMPVFKMTWIHCSSNKDHSLCPICLSEFEYTDELHLLPKCKHGFHKECIDQWLEEHRNCPVCREEVKAQDFSLYTNIICNVKGSILNSDRGAMEGESSERMKEENKINCGADHVQNAKEEFKADSERVTSLERRITVSDMN